MLAENDHEYSHPNAESGHVYTTDLQMVGVESEQRLTFQRSTPQAS